MSKENTLPRGKLAEDAACAYLEEKGITLIARNVLYKIGEIDIVAMDGPILCFIEVRSREDTRFGVPQATVNYAKQSKIIKASSIYLSRHYKCPPLCRFDVIAVTGYGPNKKIEHFKNAFEAALEPRRGASSPWRMW